MTPFLLFAVLAACAGYALHRRWWGALLFACALMVWVITMQFIIAMMMHAGLN